jgi:hypothetical protein
MESLGRVQKLTVFLICMLLGSSLMLLRENWVEPFTQYRLNTGVIFHIDFSFLNSSPQAQKVIL